VASEAQKKKREAHMSWSVRTFKAVDPALNGIQQGCFSMVYFGTNRCPTQGIIQDDAVVLKKKMSWYASECMFVPTLIVSGLCLVSFHFVFPSCSSLFLVIASFQS